MDGPSLHSSSVNSNLSPSRPQTTSSSGDDEKRESVMTLWPPNTSNQISVAPGVQNHPGLGALDPSIRGLNLIQTDPSPQVYPTETQDPGESTPLQYVPIGSSINQHLPENLAPFPNQDSNFETSLPQLVQQKNHGHVPKPVFDSNTVILQESLNFAKLGENVVEAIRTNVGGKRPLGIEPYQWLPWVIYEVPEENNEAILVKWILNQETGSPCPLEDLALSYLYLVSHITHYNIALMRECNKYHVGLDNAIKNTLELLKWLSDLIFSSSESSSILGASNHQGDHKGENIDILQMMLVYYLSNRKADTSLSPRVAANVIAFWHHQDQQRWEALFQNTNNISLFIDRMIQDKKVESDILMAIMKNKDLLPQDTKARMFERERASINSQA
ncbi:hypothetical protein PGT21_035556 [Puccinia graminis f. sp. tritici]|uniref:Uncharacterized protein n=1 Tax=Puccinia graminis f. sp. tritici TaxID=56615 RepID=A0A5B0N6C1_PUCGR|nr:hypothetical protein PGT21_035556 [Puccinia graminis f. sp. tritici]